MLSSSSSSLFSSSSSSTHRRRLSVHRTLEQFAFAIVIAIVSSSIIVNIVVTGGTFLCQILLCLTAPCALGEASIDQLLCFDVKQAKPTTIKLLGGFPAVV